MNAAELERQAYGSYCEYARKVMNSEPLPIEVWRRLCGGPTLRIATEERESPINPRKRL